MEYRIGARRFRLTTVIALMMVAAVIGGIVIGAIKSASFERVTGVKIHPFDAVFLDLRVEARPASATAESW